MNFISYFIKKNCDFFWLLDFITTRVCPNLIGKDIWYGMNFQYTI